MATICLNGQNPKLSLYIISQGYIGQAWRNGWHFEPALPSYQDQKKAYIEKVKKLGYGKREIDNLSMHSRLYASMRIKQGSYILGILIVESMQPNRFKENVIKSLMQTTCKNITPLLEIQIRFLENKGRRVTGKFKNS